MNQNVILTTAVNRPQAEMIAGLLQAESIPCMLQPFTGLSIPGAYDMGMVRIMVAHQDLGKASSLLQAMEGMSATDISVEE
jgi:hypothetical protein